MESSLSLCLSLSVSLALPEAKCVLACHCYKHKIAFNRTLFAPSGGFQNKCHQSRFGSAQQQQQQHPEQQKRITHKWTIFGPDLMGLDSIATPYITRQSDVNSTE